MKILIAADGSSYTKRMLAYLAAHDEWLGAGHAYTVMHTVTPVVARAARVIPREVLRSYYEQSAETVFKPIRTFFKKQGIEAGFVSEVGDPGVMIARRADAQRVDLVMLGSHGHGSLGNLFLGSVASKVIAGCKAPVLVIR